MDAFSAQTLLSGRSDASRRNLIYTASVAVVVTVTVIVFVVAIDFAVIDVLLAKVDVVIFVVVALLLLKLLSILLPLLPLLMLLLPLLFFAAAVRPRQLKWRPLMIFHPSQHSGRIRFSGMIIRVKTI